MQMLRLTVFGTGFFAKYAPTRFHSFIIGGANPYQFNQDEIRWWLQLLEKGMDAVGAMYDEAAATPETKMTPEMKARLLANDTRALTAFLLAPEWQASLEDALPTMTMPCLIFVGETDSECAGARECVKHMQNAEFISFPGLGHHVYAHSHLVLPHVTKFLEKASQR
jgi:pimeloyl-ACP methyl ester carboxylesterase